MAIGKGTDEHTQAHFDDRRRSYQRVTWRRLKTTGGNLVKYFAKVEEVARASGSAADKTVILTEKQKNLALTMAGTQVAVKQATDDLAALTKASDDYAASITGAIKGTVDLSTAFSAAQQASQDGTLAAGESVVSTTIANFRRRSLPRNSSRTR
jgi:hypothetical protein